MDKSFASERVTEGIRVIAQSFYIPDESMPDMDRFVFGYRIQLRNESRLAVKLLTRHWIIIDGNGLRQEVRGEGVIGQQPELAPGESFRYSSFARIGTEWGSMQGSYGMQRDDGSLFNIEVGRFILAVRASVPQNYTDTSTVPPGSELERG